MDKFPDLQLMQSYIEKPISRVHKFYILGENQARLRIYAVV